MKHTISTLVILALALATGCRSTPEIPLQPFTPVKFEEIPPPKQSREEIKKELEKLQKLPEDQYRISANDQFVFRVYDNEELNVDLMTVSPDGYISVGLIGPVKIGGMTIVEATEDIQQRLKKFIRYPKVSLAPFRVQSSAFTINGKVNRPGCYPINGKLRISDAIAMAEGFSVGLFQSDTVELADLENAIIVRKGKVLPVDFIKAIREGDYLNNIPLRNGDYIYIPSSMNRSVYILGEVNNPSYVGYKENMTLIQLIAYANGLKDTNAENILVIRGGMVHPKVYKINVDQLMTGKGIDFALEPNDIVYVPRGGLSEYNTTIRKLFPTAELINLLMGPFGNVGLNINSSN
ncbi:MAG: SLBB domain-containing protein [Victivallales bacterium]|nr:SLBB domain-containing protein [Victivallales bacterium]